MITPHILKSSLNKPKNILVILLTLSKSKVLVTFKNLHKLIAKIYRYLSFYFCMSIFLSIHTFMNVETS